LFYYHVTVSLVFILNSSETNAGINISRGDTDIFLA
jgi:hypothetical protein